MTQDPQLSLNDQELSGKPWREAMLETLRQIADSLDAIRELDRRQDARHVSKQSRQWDRPIYRRMDADRLVISASNGKVDCVYFILTPATAKSLDVHPGQKGRIYDDLSCNPKAEGGRRAAWQSWKGCLKLRSSAEFDVPCMNDWEIWELKTNEGGLLVKSALLEKSEPTL